MFKSKWIALGICAFALGAAQCHADTIYGGQTFVASGTNGVGNPVNVQALISGSGNTLTIAVSNLEVPTQWASNQAISGISFALGNTTPPGTIALTGSTGDLIKITQDAVPTDVGVVGSATTLGLTPWQLSSSGVLTTLTGGQPSEMIVGAANGAGGTYHLNGNGNGFSNFDPYVKITATFTITVNSLNANSFVSALTFNFGTAADGSEGSLPGTNPNVVTPLPSSLVMLGTMLVPGLGAFWYRRRNQTSVVN
jgi:hypothetical protein